MTGAATVRVSSAEGMRALGARLASVLQAGDLVVLDGPLGAGKTTLTQGLGRGLHVVGDVSSPTFVIARRHRGADDGAPMLHVDAYRLSAGELVDLDLDVEAEDAVAVVEWGRGKVEDWSDDRLEVVIALEDDTPSCARIVTITGHGDRWGAIPLADAAAP